MGWFDTQEVSEKARAIAADYCRLRASGAAMAIAAQRQERRYDKLAVEALAFSKGLGLNVYKKSRFLQDLRAGLAEGGVPSTEADAFVEGVMMGPLGPLAGPR
jgi:hypothetical protein